MLRSSILLLLWTCPLALAFVGPVFPSCARPTSRELASSDTRLFVGVVGPGDKQNARKKTEQEATDALLNAKEALQKTQVPSMPSQEVLAAAAGGALLGAGLDVVAGQPVDPVVPAALLGGAALVAASDPDNETGRLTREVLGKPTAAAGNFFVQQIKSFLGAVALKITSLPEQIKTALQQQVERTQESVASLPARLFKFLQAKTHEAVLEVQRWPQRWAEFLTQKAQDAANEVSATPGRVARMASMAAEDALREAQALPRRKIDEFIQAMDQLGVEDEAQPREFTPTPPKMPPPADKLQARPRSVLFRQFKK